LLVLVLRILGIGILGRIFMPTETAYDESYKYYTPLFSHPKIT